MVDAARRVPSLLVFSDDWGRHPSSCQHLIRELLATHRVCWVNTIGTRTPKLDRATLQRAAEKLQQWRVGRKKKAKATERQATGETFDHSASIAPQVINPRMWPWFTRALDRRLNRMLLEGQLQKAIAEMPQPVVAVTTLPITADLVGRLPVAGWVYYCVDDFREWPGLDGRTLGRMEEHLVRKVDEIVVVSETLRTRMSHLGREATLLTHGCDLSRWQASSRAVASVSGAGPAPNAVFSATDRPILFWGVIDRRTDVAFVRRLSEAIPDHRIVFVGPQQDPDPDLLNLKNVECHPPVPFDSLPNLAAAASVLIMPYTDSPVTRAMQPLKLKEYLATGKPVVVRSLPATHEWSDCLDEASTPDAFAAAVKERLKSGLPSSQWAARERLKQESWSSKAEQLGERFRAVLSKPGRESSRWANRVAELAKV
ncbi:MAG: glycosyltransferase [Planctomycetaceae bacterium]|nr:glycosyltransferase [Planctomycetaceae bacterium]